MATPPNPLTPPDPTQGMMGQAQQTMNNPNAQGVPPASGALSGLANHPIIQQIGQALAKAMQNIGFSGATPQVRQQGQEMENQKAETMARMAQTGAFQQGEIENRRNMTTIAGQNANTKQADVASKVQTREDTVDINKAKLELSQEANEWKQDIATGRLSSANKRIENQANQFEQIMANRMKNTDINQAKLGLEQQGLGIKQGFLDVANAALGQKGTQEGIQALTQLRDLQYKHPIMSQLFGLDDVNAVVSKASGAGIPGTSPTGAPTTGAPTAPLPSPAQPQRPTNKVDAIRNKNKPQQGKPGDPLGIL